MNIKEDISFTILKKNQDFNIYIDKFAFHSGARCLTASPITFEIMQPYAIHDACWLSFSKEELLRLKESIEQVLN